MRYVSKKDCAISVTIWSVIIVLILSVVVSPSQIRFAGTIAVLLVISFLLWIYFGTYYEFCDEYLYARSGPFVERIRYDQIIEIKKTRNFLSSMALSLDRILIRTRRKSLAGLTFISPDNRDAFYEELHRRCPHLINN